MATNSSDVIDRIPSGRFVRNLALSLSGGALLTLIGAGIAQADEAATASDGQGAAGTGDATAVGNRSGTQATQGTGASTGTGNLQVITQNGGVANTGVAVANTGGNIAVGNASTSGATAGQTATGGPLGLAVNNGNASNASDGGALITTGDAYAIGNESTTTLDQRADGSAHGTLGSVLVLSQNALVVNAGLGISNTGLNIAAGNTSGTPGISAGPNNAGLLQNAVHGGAGTGGAINSGEATNTTNGRATISTGSASSTGNRSDTHVSQIAGSADGDGPDPSGLSVVTQLGGALNAGAALANTGVNGAVGNASSSTATVDPQTAAATFDSPAFANNSGSAANASDGTAWITTGSATAIGNDSTTAIVQDAHAEFGDQGVNIQTQFAPVVNVGLAASNTGVNGAIGNVSTSTADTEQAATGDTTNPLPIGLAVVNNSGEAANSSNGTAAIHTGDAWAQGNWSDTEVSQWTEADGTALAVQTQVELVANVGVGVANSGVNGAVGNASGNAAVLSQNNLVDPATSLFLTAVVNNSGSASNDSDGTATIATGDAYASGNESTTRINQAIDPTGVAVQTQAGLVVNAGLGLSNSGVNGAVGNVSNNLTGDNGATAGQTNRITDGPVITGTLVSSASGEASNTSNGTASIATGDAWSVGNHSDTGLSQNSNASTDGLGAAVNTQLGVVGNVGAGVSNSGVNGAVGNASTNRAELGQVAFAQGSLTAFGVTANNSGSAANNSDGTAIVTTGDATAKGNVSVTDLAQTADASVNGLGIVVNTQVGGVVNGGLAIANSGGNVAIGNVSDNEAFAGQSNTLGGAGSVFLAPAITSNNSGEASNTSDGTGEIHTGAASARGNTSDTRLRQNVDGTVDGLGAVVNTQLGGVANVGLGFANSGINLAVGNGSNNDAGDALGASGLVQGSGIATGGADVTALGPITSSNAGRAANDSDGWGYIHTGAARANGNVSATALGQDATGNVGEDAMGVVPNLQAAGVLNVGAGVANSGVNLSVGNASGTGILPPLVPAPPGLLPENDASLFQSSIIAPGAGDDLTVAGPVTSNNSGEVGSSSDGTGKVFTGTATANGNVSSTNLNQNVRGNVNGMGLVVGPQLGLVVNAGAGVANSGINASFGNVSNSTADSLQTSTFDPAAAAIVVGPLTVGNNGAAINTSDGEACVCTGNATATGNTSVSTLSQDLNIGVDDGLSVVPTTGVILNAGFGLANTGVNAAIGNISQNLATSSQTTALDPLAPALLIGPQTLVNSGGADNASDGLGEVGTGNARADGNISASDLIQGVSVDGAGAFAQVNGAIGNVGAGVANAGVNAGIGNASSNSAALVQAATGSGTVANQGRASNASDGSGQVGDPNCDVPKEEAPPAEETPGVPGLPKTGGPLEVEAALGLMLLLAGFGFRRVSRTVARRA